MLFKEERARPRDVFGPIVAIEHIGSTSVLGWRPSRSSICWSACGASLKQSLLACSLLGYTLHTGV
ncbi:hypothetical protein [Bradyrhizobium sp. AZCC 2262]|uniref:hypothetical protein n=1 Tax=Bradyrhizobium sp. AZCC 2262 TaxID=3117022 RepID=UPI002FF3928D